LIVAVGAATPALADGSFPKVDNDTVLLECSDCHLAYQPQMLPQRSWRKLMDGLADHFGEELSLEGETRDEVLGYFLDNAADSGKTSVKSKKRKKSKKKRGHRFMEGLGRDDAPIRITETPRWRKNHHELPDRVWSDPRVEFKGQCEVCHTEAERGRYDDDHGLRVPGPFSPSGTFGQHPRNSAYLRSRASVTVPGLRIARRAVSPR
jgi:hypothetical protein